jgi:hypothetical protein
LAGVPAVLVAALLGGSLYTATPDAYPGGWYRLYTPCELDALKDVARQADASPHAVVVTGAWESKLVLAALAGNASRIWYAGSIFTSEKTRGDLVANMDYNHRPVILVVDRYLRTDTPDADTSFALQAPWHETGSYCAGTGVGTPRVLAYSTEAPS